MKKIAFIGDIHLSYKTPDSRMDNYAETVLNKLKQAFIIAAKENADYIIFLGDFFHSRDIPYSYINMVLEIFKQVSSKFKKMYTIAGNHDLPYHRIDLIEKTPLQTLLSSGLVTLLDSVVIEGWSVNGFSIGQEVKAADKQIFSDSYYFDDTALKNLGYKLYVLGHDHKPYPTVNTEEYMIIRPGSLTRGTADKYNFDREVRIGFMELIEGVLSPRLYWKVLDIEPAANVFRIKNKDKRKDISDVSKYILEFLNNTNKKTADFYTQNLYAFLDDMKDIPDNLRSFIENKLEEKGIIRT